MEATVAGESGARRCCVWWQSLHLLPCLCRAAFHFWHTAHWNYRGRDARQGQARQHRETAPRERAVPGTRIQHIVLLSICTLTIAELDICQRR